MHFTRQRHAGPAIVAILAVFCVAGDDASSSPSGGNKVVLVELFTSQGCDSCPSAERLLGELASMGYPADRVVPVAFHVDYFNEPWKDPLSEKRFSEREYRYSVIFDKENDTKNPNYLYLTPLMMIDGRVPMLGCDDAGRNHKAKVKIREHLDRALREPVRVGLSTTLSGSSSDTKRSLSIDVKTLAPDLVGRDVLIEVATVEDGLATRVRSGENAGKTYLSHSAARSLSADARKLPDVGKTLSTDLPITLPAGSDAKKVSLAVFVQDDANGRVFQAASVPWTTKQSAKSR